LVIASDEKTSSMRLKEFLVLRVGADSESDAAAAHTKSWSRAKIERHIRQIIWQTTPQKGSVHV
jgi:hypothetical protein